MFALASWLTNTQAGGSSNRVRQKLNGRVSYLPHEAFLHLAPQHSLSLTPPSAWRKRQFKPPGELLPQRKPIRPRLYFACDGLPTWCFMATTPKKALRIQRQNRAVPW